MKNENSEIGARIKVLRLSQGLTRERLAEYSNISTQFLADIEAGNKGMTVATLKKLCNALHVSADYIVFGADNDLTVSVDSLLKTLPSDKQMGLFEIVQRIIKLDE